MRNVHAVVSSGEMGPKGKAGPEGLQGKSGTPGYVGDAGKEGSSGKDATWKDTGAVCARGWLSRDVSQT